MRFVGVVRRSVRVNYFCLCLFMRKVASVCSDAPSLGGEIQNCLDFGMVTEEL